jgi:transcriptional regulator with XRE-family HTH domain
VQKALIELRRRLGETQQSMSDRLGVSLQSIARWETSDPPVNITLATLHQIAEDNGHHDLADAFKAALDVLKEAQQRKANDILDEIARWHMIRDHLTSLGQEADRLRNEKLKDVELPQRIVDRLTALDQVLAAAQKWSWRNR